MKVSRDHEPDGRTFVGFPRNLEDIISGFNVDSDFKSKKKEEKFTTKFSICLHPSMNTASDVA